MQVSGGCPRDRLGPLAPSLPSGRPCVCGLLGVGVLGYKEVPRPKCLQSLWFSHCQWLGLGSATSFQFPPSTRTLPPAETRVPFLTPPSRHPVRLPIPLYVRVSSPVPRPPPLAPCLQASPCRSVS